MNKIIILLFVSLFSLSSYADNFYNEHAVGWHWYDDPVQKVTPQNAIPKMDTVKQRLKVALDQALLNPTPEHVRNYIQLQNAWSNQASKFEQVWQQVLITDPTLNYSLVHPVNQIGRQVYLDQQQEAEHQAIAALAKHSGLFFFYRSNCPYCQRFAPILKDFSERYGITVIPITTNGIALPQFPQSHVDDGQAARFHVSAEPAVFTVNPYTHKAIPVSYGLVTEDELKSRILNIAKGGV